ncbi:cell wall integrity and stress response component [Microdochium nivale]|nr:cell wall integrity and stress response component [Microdochium nivale]
MIVPIYAVFAGLLVSRAMSQVALSACAAGCVNGVLADASKVGCGVGDTACVCSSIGAVTNGIRDCVAQACAAEGADQITLAETSAKDRCAAVQAPSASTTAPAAEPTTAPPAGAVSTSQSTTEAISATSTISTTSTTSTSATVESTPTAVGSSSTTSAATSESPTSATTESSTSSSASSSVPTSTETSSSTQSGETAEQTGAAEPPKTEESGLSVATKAGIGAGVGVALIMMGIAAICLTVRRKQKENEARRNNMIEISGPMSGGGQQWANEEDGKYGSATTADTRKSYNSELDHHARPYEEMVPHTQPRTMI